MLINEDFFDDNTEVIDSEILNDEDGQVQTSEDNDNYDYVLTISSTIAKKRQEYYTWFKKRLEPYFVCFEKYYVAPVNSLKIWWEVFILKYSLPKKPNGVLLYNFFLFFGKLVNEGKFSIDIKKRAENFNNTYYCKNFKNPNLYKIQPCVATLFAIHELSEEYIKLISERKLKNLVCDKWPDEILCKYFNKLCKLNKESDFSFFLPFSNIISHFSDPNGYSLTNNSYISDSLDNYITSDFFVSFKYSLKHVLLHESRHNPELIISVEDFNINKNLCIVYLDILKSDKMKVPVIGLTFIFTSENNKIFVR